jgi:predicted esterase
VAPPRPAAVVAVLAALVVGLTATLSAASPRDTPVGGAAAATATATTTVTAPPAAAPPTALRLTGSTADGWERYDLADGRLPAAVPAGRVFRGEVHLRVAGVDRAVRVLVPASAPSPAPVLVALHGMYQSVQATEHTQGWGTVARRAGAVLVYGIGSHASWDAGTCCGRAAAEHVDDLAYLDRVVALAGALHPADPRRLFLTGFSNGAMMAYRYACARRDRVAAVLAVSGTVVAACRGRSDVAVLAVHGAADRTVPLAGLAWSPALRTSLRPVSATARMFGPTISARVLPGFGHGWPTLAHGGYDTTGRGWAFLAAHPRRW